MKLAVLALATIASLASARVGANPRFDPRPKTVHPTSFTFDASRSKDAPTMKMNFANLDSQDISLHRHSMFRDIPAEKFDCAYLGYLKNDLSSSVAVTGCFTTEPSYVTVVSRSIYGQYKVSKDGSVEVLPDPLAHPDVRDVVADRQGAFHLQDGDELVNDEIEAAAAAIDCSTNPSATGCTLPDEVLMKVATHYDQSLNDKENDVISWINEVMVHTQAHMFHSSLGVRIKIELVGSPTFHPGYKWRADNDIYFVRQFAAGDNSADLHTFFVRDEVEYYGVVGIAFLGVMCTLNQDGYQVSINEWRQTKPETAKVVAHEFGHNLGAAHDFDDKHQGRGCTGIMDYGTTPDLWSACSADDIRDHYAEVVQYLGGTHCMEAITSTTTAPPAPTTAPPTNAPVPTTLPPPAPTTASPTTAPPTTTLPPPAPTTASPTTAPPTTTLPPPAPTTAPPTTASPSGCGSPHWKGDSYCDDENNNPGCDYDGGDCCGFTEYWWSFCTQCQCLDPAEQGCGSPHWKGDAYCDDENNNAGCDFDGGDCCNNNYYWWNYYCNVCNCFE